MLEPALGTRELNSAITYCFQEGIFEITKTTGQKTAAEMPEHLVRLLKTFDLGHGVDEAAEVLGITSAKAWRDCEQLHKRLRVHDGYAARIMGRLVGLLP